MKRSPTPSAANMDVRVEGSDSRLDRDLGAGDEEFDFNLFHFWDFPMENVVDDFPGDWDDSSLGRLGPVAMDALTPPAVQCPKVDTFRIDEHIDESKPEQLPECVGITSKSCILDQNASLETRESGAFQTQSSDSVVESSSSCYAGIFGAIPGKPRSRTVKRRPRLKPWSPMTRWDATRHGSRTTKLSRSPLYSLQSSDAANKLHSSATKKCTHCEITRTPQWREGPLGPKTLCNACGVRYRSGRLFPEYRPAASPTFVPDLHSNSHRKVLEMRNIGTRHARKMDVSRLFAVRI